MKASKGVGYLAIIFVVLTSIVSACASPSAPSQQAKPAAEKPSEKPAAANPPEKASRPLEKIKIQIPARSAAYLPLFLAIEKGMFTEEGLDVETVELKGDLAIPALEKGEVDYVGVFGRPIQAAIIGEPTRILLADTAKAVWHLVMGKGITSPQQLKGKSVAINMKGGSLHFATILSLKQLGLDPDKDVTFVVIPTYSDMVVALNSGAIGAAGLEASEAYRAIGSGLKEAIFTGDVVDIPSSGLATTVKRIQDNPDQVKRAIRAYLKSMAYGRDHKDEVVQLVMKELKTDRETAESVAGDQIKVWSYHGMVSEQGLATFLETIKAGGGPQKDATLEQVKAAVDYTLLKDAQKELGITK